MGRHGSQDAVSRAKDAAEAFEQARQDAFSPVGNADPGATLADATAADLAALHMSPGVEVPKVGPLTSFPGELS